MARSIHRQGKSSKPHLICAAMTLPKPAASETEGVAGFQDNGEELGAEVQRQRRGPWDKAEREAT